MIRHYYHVYADGKWKFPVQEHFVNLRASGLLDALGVVYVGMVGSFGNREYVHSYLQSLDVPYEVVSSTDGGWEQETLDVIHADAKVLEPHPVYYAHTKGSANPQYEIQGPWRACLEHFNTTRWRDRLQDLEEGFDASGCLWMLPENRKHINWGFYAGNYWWADSQALARLNPPVRGTRWDAEVWVGGIHAELGLPVTSPFDIDILDVDHVNSWRRA